MKTIREICVYDKIEDNLINSFPINISISILSTVFQEAPLDDNYFKVYKITEKEYNLLTKHVPKIIKYNVDAFDLFMESSSE